MKDKARSLLLWSEKYTKTDMTYLATGSFWLSVAKGISSLCALATSIIFANFLPEETYGVFRYALSGFVLLSLLTLAGLDTAIVKSVANGFTGTVTKAFTKKLQFGLIASVFSLCLSGYYFVNENNTLSLIFLLGALFVPVMESSYIFVSYLNGHKDFFRIALYVSTTRVIAAVLLILCVLITDNVIIIIGTYICSHLLLRMLFLSISLKKYPPTKMVDSEAINFGKHLSVTQGITQIAGTLDKILIFNFVGGAALAGYYLALVPYKHINNILSSVSTLALPKMAKRDVVELRKTLPALLSKTYILIFPIIISYWITADFLFSVALPRYTDYVFISKIIVLLLLLYPINILQTALTSQNAKKELYQITFGTAISRIILLAIFVPIYGVWGAVGVILTTHLLQAVLTIILFMQFKNDQITNSVISDVSL